MGRRTTNPLTLGWDDAWSSFVRHRTAENISPNTLAVYTAAQAQLRTRLATNATPAAVTRDDIHSYMGHLLATGATSTAATRYWGLRAFFGWLVDEGEMDRSPLEGLRPPRVEARPPDVITDAEVAALLAACDGRAFEDRRDAAANAEARARETQRRLAPGDRF